MSIHNPDYGFGFLLNKLTKKTIIPMTTTVIVMQVLPKFFAMKVVVIVVECVFVQIEMVVVLILVTIVEFNIVTISNIVMIITTI